MGSLADMVDLTNCEREPINLIGSVQPFGFLLAVSAPDWTVVRASRNAADWLGAAPNALIGHPVKELFQEEAIHTIRGHLHTAIMGDTVARAFDIPLTAAGLHADIALHVSGQEVVIECEPSTNDPVDDSGAMVRSMVARLQNAGDLRTLYRVAAREMRALTGFDRVMIYRFDEDESGEVIAESAGAGLESYLGLHYPASDIPRQARLLYQRNWLRIISDVNASPSPIEPTLDAQGRPLDLSMSVLRSVSPIHIEYLRNMGVVASMSVSILSGGKLWGLFACHHYAPRRVPFGRRTAAELFGQMFSLLMENREREGEAAYEARAQKLHQQLVTVMAGEAMQFESIVAHLEDIADLLTCDGVGVWTNGKATLKGLTPTEEQFAGLVSFLHAKQIVDVHARREIAAAYPPARDFSARAAGMLVVPLSKPPRDYLIFFRTEFARSVNWAGDPSKPVTAGPLGERLTPRKSFELWKETVIGQSLHWLPVECRIAENLRVSLLEVILRLSDITENERRQAQQRHELLIDELNHRVRNILSLIRGVISQSKESATSVDSFTEIVGGRILALARAHDQITADEWGPAPFASLVQAEAGAYLGKSDRVTLEGPTVLLEPSAFTTIALVMHEIVTNSAKYGALSDSRGRVSIKTSVNPAGKLVIDWAEQGGPPVKSPTRRGFGSTVIERSIVHDLKGEVALDYALAGLRARFEVPAEHFRVAPMATAANRSPSREATHPGVVFPADVLLVEDNMIIALDVESMLRDAGVASVRMASGVPAALAMTAERQPAFALLDVNLGGETSFELAGTLRALKVPFLFMTGYGEQLSFPAEFVNSGSVRKPFTPELLLLAIRRRLGDAGKD
jgi:light-regulated signal transduction histidine kinase (bacteriophytochrome)